MKNSHKWQETKFEICKDRLTFSRNNLYLGVSSRLIASYIAEFYTQAIPRFCKGKLADIGCGNMPLYGFYRKYVDDVVAIDWANSLHNIQFLDIVADLNQMPIPGVNDNDFDTIICSDVLEHLYHPKEFLKELYRILRKEGHLLLNVPFHYWIHEAPFDFHRYTPYCLRKMFEEAGLEIIEFYELGRAIDVFADLNAKILTCNCQTLGNLLSPFIQFLPKIIKRGSHLRCINEAKASSFTLAYAIVAKKS